MKKLACVIAEYHPFHNGHAEMVRQLKDQGYLVAAVMSGNFVQRGTPALLPKSVRCAAALAGGVDVVFELPCAEAAASAGHFADAGVAAAAAMGADSLVFGAENADTVSLQKICDLLCGPAFSAALQHPLSEGLSFAAARSVAAQQLLPGSAQILALPNNILAVEYLSALRRLQEKLGPLQSDRVLPLPVVFPRSGADHDGDPKQGIASAGWLRSQPLADWQPYVPVACYDIYLQAEKKGLLLDARRWEQTALTLLRTRTRQQLATLPDMCEGLDALLFRAVRDATSLEELYSAVKSKRYAHARIRRTVLAAAVGWWPEAAVQSENAAPLHPFALNGALPYLRVLGAGPDGRKLLGEIAERCPLPISPSLLRLQERNSLCAAVAAREARTGDLYALCLKKPLPCGEEYRMPFLTPPDRISLP